MESVLLDVDDTFFNSRQVLADAIQAEYGLVSDPDTWRTYHFAKIYNIPEDDVINAWIKQDVFSKMNLAPGAYAFHSYCMERGIHIEFVTARGFDPDAHDKTIKALTRKLFVSPEVGNYSVTVTNWAEPKHEMFTSDSPILFADDSPTHVRDMQTQQPGVMSLLMSQPHNTDVRMGNVASIDGTYLRVVKSMWDVLDVLTYLRGHRLTHSIRIPGFF